MRKILPRLKQNVWPVCFVILMVVGVYAAYERVISAPPPDSQLDLPWSLTAALNVGCGLGLATGGFAVAAIIRTARIESAHSLLRSSLISAFLGYLVACLGLLADQSVVKRVCAPSPNLTPSAVSVAVNCAFVLFGMSVVAEFAADIKLSQRWKSLTNTLVLFRTPLLWLGFVLSLFCQWVIGDTLRRSTKASTLWATPWLVLLFFISGACASLAISIMAFVRVQRSSSSLVNLKVLDGARRILATLVFLYVQARLADLLERGQISLLHADPQSSLLIIEVALFVIPMLVLASQTVPSSKIIFYCGAAIIAAFICNRLNTFITSLEMPPRIFQPAPWHEFAVSYCIVVIGVVCFHLLTNRLSVFESFSRGESVSGPGFRRV